MGDIKDREDILDLIKDLRLNDKVTLHGILKHSELEKMYKIAHVNMMLSNNNSNKDFEGFGKCFGGEHIRYSSNWCMGIRPRGCN